jgi:chorismate synthase
MSLRFLTAGESHGKALMGIIEGMPSDLRLEHGDIDGQLRRRQGGYGRGGRMKIEADSASILSGVRWGKTLGSPITLMIENRDFSNWAEGMSAGAAHEGSIDPVTRPRPGHADLAGAQKYSHTDMRNILERSSARETAMRVAIGAVCRRLLEEFGVTVGSYVISVGDVELETAVLEGKGHQGLFEQAEASEMRCPDPAATERMKAAIDTATKDGNSLGGVFVVFAEGLTPGLGSHVQWDRRLDGLLAQALMSIQAIKGVEAGMGFESARRPGSEVMDEIVKGTDGKLARSTNNAGGIEGGMTNGMPLVMRAAMKPIPTLRRSLKSVDITTGEAVEAAYERSDVCAVPAAAVIGEAVVSSVLAGVFLEKFGGDSIGEILRNLRAYMDAINDISSGPAGQ